MLFTLFVVVPGLLVLTSIVAVGLWQTRNFEYSPLTHPINGSQLRHRIFVTSVLVDRLLIGLVMTLEAIAKDVLWVREILVGLMDLDIRTQPASTTASSTLTSPTSSPWLMRAMNLIQTQRRVSARVQGHYVRELAAEQFAISAARAASSTSAQAPDRMIVAAAQPCLAITSSATTTVPTISVTTAPWDDETDRIDGDDDAQTECEKAAGEHEEENGSAGGDSGKVAVGTVEAVGAVGAIDDFLDSR